MKVKDPCVVCQKPGTRSYLCAACQRSHDASLDRDTTIMGAIIWAANRARYFASRVKRPTS